MACHRYSERGFTYGARRASDTHMVRAAAAACKAVCCEPEVLLHTRLSLSVDVKSGADIDMGVTDV